MNSEEGASWWPFSFAEPHTIAMKEGCQYIIEVNIESVIMAAFSKGSSLKGVAWMN